MRPWTREDHLRFGVQTTVFVGIFQQQHVALIPTRDVNSPIRSHGDDPGILKALRQGAHVEAAGHLQGLNTLGRRVDLGRFERVNVGLDVGSIALLSEGERGGQQDEQKRGTGHEEGLALRSVQHGAGAVNGLRMRSMRAVHHGDHRSPVLHIAGFLGRSAVRQAFTWGSLDPHPSLDTVSLRPTREEDIMAELKENLLDWLRDAHAMEQQAETMLKGQASRIEHYPVLKARIEEHIQETIGQRELLEGCIKRLGGSPSTLKDVMGKMAAFGQAVGGMTASDEIVKGAMAGYVFEHFEIASYTALIAAAKTAGDAETARVCEEILVQEEAMADWLAAHLPEVTEEFMVRDATPGVEAKK